MQTLDISRISNNGMFLITVLLCDDIIRPAPHIYETLIVTFSYFFLHCVGLDCMHIVRMYVRMYACMCVCMCVCM